MAKRRIRVVTAKDQAAKPKRQVISTDVNPKVTNNLTDNEKRARRYATTTSMGGFSFRTGTDVLDSGTSQFYSPQLSTDFLEKPQNLRERRAFYRFFYNTNEIIGQAIDIHSTLPLSKLRLVPPKGKNKHQNDYVFKFFQKMCEDMKLFKTLIEITHEYYLFGNCLADRALVKTPFGLKRAEDVNIGDLLLTDKGRYRKVLKKCSRPSEQILNIKCWKDFRELPVSEEHPIEILRDDEFIFVQAEELSLNDYVRVTWPTEIKDTEYIAFEYVNSYKKVEKGYELNFKVPHPRNPIAVRARKKLISWLSSLSEPTIKTRKQLSEDFDVPLSTLNNVIYKLGKELSVKFHERIGASGFQKGSQVKWLPLNDDYVEVTDTYTIHKTKFLKAVDGIEIDNDFAYLAGYWLGDGTLARDSERDTWGRGLWQIVIDKDFEGVDRIRKILNKIFSSDCVTEWESNNQIFLRVISNPAFIEWWAENFGETSFGKNHKRIPEWLVQLPEEKLKHFLAGMVDSDGCVSHSGEKKNTIVNISMASRSVMDGVRDIALKCGVIISYNEGRERNVTLPQGNDIISKKMYTIITSDEESSRIITQHSTKEIPSDAQFSRMERYWIRTDAGLAFKIKDIKTEEYNDLVYNFEIEEDHTYQVAGFSTHNCFIFAEEDDWKESIAPDELSSKKEEAKQRSQLLQDKYEINDKNPLYKGWKKLLILPPDQVRVRKLPLTDEVAIEYMPDPETRKFLTSDVPLDPTDPTKKLDYSISRELREKVRQSGVIPLDTDPNTGSHVYHLARKKSQYEPLGVSIVERCINTLILMDKLRQAQTSIASRHMTPMRIVWAEDLNQDDVDNLREQVDLALVDPDFSIVANYEIHWEEMGSSGRLLDVEAEMESSLNRLLAGLGVTREVLTGEGTYTGSKISLEIMNTMYLLFREVIQEYIENYLFKPIAKKKGFVEYDDYGNEVLLYPKISFTRLAIRDNEQFFDAAFQLYQKGSVSIDLILDILNIDPDATRDKIERDLFTVNDSLFNEVMRNVYTNVAAPLVDNTNVAEKIAEYLKLQMAPKEEAPAEEGASRFSNVVEHQKKLAKIMKYFSEHPEKVEQIFDKV